VSMPGRQGSDTERRAGLVRSRRRQNHVYCSVNRELIMEIVRLLFLLHPAPDIQEAILFLPRVVRGRDPICLEHLGKR